MQSVYQVLQIVAPVFALGLVGIVWVRAGWQYDVEFVTRLSMTISIPCLIFMALLRSEVDLSVLRDTTFAALGAYALVAVISLAAVRISGLAVQTYLAPLIFGNTGNIGLPLALFAFGDTGLSLAVVVFATMAILAFTFGVWLASGGGSPLRVLGEPMVGATILGGVFMLNGWSIPQWTANTLDLVGQIAIPLMLITLGVAVARLRVSAAGRALGLAVFKLAVCLGSAVIAGRWFGLAPVAFGVLVLQVSMPVAVTSFMLAEKYDAGSEEVAGLVVISTLLSLVAIPVTLAFLI
ncbi:MAG: AEC family transporter [Paracoccaceae bacterium]